jgi:hypothetical protein
MKGKIFGLLAAALLAGPITAIATPSYAPVDFLGTLDVTCVGYSAADCGTGGVVAISGSLSSSGMLDIGVAGDPKFFVGTLSGNNTLTGLATSLDGDVYNWTFTRTIAPITSPIVGDWSGTGTPVVIGSGNGATELADVVITSAAKAPEIDSASAASGVALLVGALIVLRGRKQQSIAA